MQALRNVLKAKKVLAVVLVALLALAGIKIDPILVESGVEIIDAAMTPDPVVNKQ